MRHEDPKAIRVIVERTAKKVYVVLRGQEDPRAQKGREEPRVGQDQLAGGAEQELGWWANKDR